MEFWLYDNTTNTRQTLNVDLNSITPVMTIGRDSDNTIALRSPFVARHHAKVELRGNLLFVENLSRSQLRVANRDLDFGHEVRLDFGDEIQIAQYAIALVRAGRKQSGSDDRIELQRRLIGFEQLIHNELLERLNLRVTGHLNKNDQAYVAQIMENLDEILLRRGSQLDESLIKHMLYSHLQRLVIAEVVRQCAGKVETELSGLAGTDPAMERALSEFVVGVVDMIPLVLDPTSVQDDLEVAENEFDDLFERNFGSLSNNIKRYVIRQLIAKDLHDIMFGFGPLQDLLEMANVSEIMVVGKDTIFVEKNGVIQATTRSFFSDDVLMSVIERILTPVGRRVDQSVPLVDARLPDGSRINVIIPPLALAGPCLTIRKFSWIPFTIDDLIERETISEQCAGFLKACIHGRKNVVVSGGTGSGKTTLLNTLCSFARPSERIITIEESAELQLPQPHVVPLEARPANVEGRGAYTIRDLVKNSLRMRPDRIIIGEVRAAEALDMLQAMNTGHDGSLATLHANNPSDVMNRIETMVLMAIDMPMRAIREQIVTAVDLVVQVRRFAHGPRRITHISEITEIDRETSVIRLEDIFTLTDPKQDRLLHTGYIPTFTEELITKGMLTVDMFL